MSPDRSPAWLGVPTSLTRFCYRALMDTNLSTGYPVAMLRMLVVILAALTLNVALLAAAAHSAGADSWQAVQEMPEGSNGEASLVYTDSMSCIIQGEPEKDSATCDWACSPLTAIAPDFSTKSSVQVAVKARSLLSTLSLNGINPPLQERPPKLRTA